MRHFFLSPHKTAAGLPLPVFLAALFVFLAPQMLPAQSRNVTVNEPGTLSTLIKATEAYRITSLIVKGKLNSDDCLLLREMAGRDAAGEPTRGQLRRLSLRGVTFCPGGTPYYGRNTTGNSQNLIPAYLFFDCPLTQLVLPASADSIADFALSGTALQHISLPPRCRLGANVFQDCARLESVKMPRYLNELLPNNLFAGCTNLKSLKFGNVDYLSSNAIQGLATLQTLTFQGTIGHMDGEVIADCPQLLSVLFEGPVLSTGGPVLIKNCPQLEQVTFFSALLDACFGQPQNCNRMEAFSLRAPVVMSEHPDAVPPTDGAHYASWQGWDSTFAACDKWVGTQLSARPFMRQAALFVSRAALKAALLLNNKTEALRHLNWLVEGEMYYADELEADTMLTPLRAMPEYQNIAAKAKINPVEKEEQETDPEVVLDGQTDEKKEDSPDAPVLVEP